MIQLKKEKPVVVLIDEEVEFLAELYLRLKRDPTKKNLQKTFRDFIQSQSDKEINIYLKRRNSNEILSALHQ